jgi:hypothetical protein
MGRLQGCFYFGNGKSHNLSQVRQNQNGDMSYLSNLRLLRFHNKNMEISNVINNIDCICSLAARSFNLKCFMVDLYPLPGDEMSLETCRNLLTNANLWKSFAKLQVLQLRGCSFLTQIPKQMFLITTLVEVDLQGCSNMTTIPKTLENLTSLTTLDLGFCRSLTTIPEGLGNLTSLTTLGLGWCESLTRIPKGLGNLTSLTNLDLGWCES